MSVDGAMLGGYMLPEDEFVKQMADMIGADRMLFVSYLTSVSAAVAANDNKSAFQIWEDFQTEILKNPVTDLLAITHFYGNKGQAQTWNFVKEVDTLDANGKMNVAKVGEDIKRAYTSDVLAQHLGQLFKTVEHDDMSLEEINAVNRHKKWKELVHAPVKPRKYKEVVYGKMYHDKYRGKVADAYINHIGEIHWNIISTFFNTQNAALLEQIATHSVKQEEGGGGTNLGFVQRLIDSLNNTAWFTGGDLIVTAPDGRVIANIQLKTSAGEGAWIGNLRTTKLQQEVNAILKSFSTESNTRIAEEFYEMLKTSSVMEEMGDAAIDSSVEDAKESLGEFVK